ncbi:hypothetical protein L195_g050791, partial [Trifolium pratense]
MGRFLLLQVCSNLFVFGASVSKKEVVLFDQVLVAGFMILGLVLFHDRGRWWWISA